LRNIVLLIALLTVYYITMIEYLFYWKSFISLRD